MAAHPRGLSPCLFLGRAAAGHGSPDGGSPPGAVVAPLPQRGRRVCLRRALPVHGWRLPGWYACGSYRWAASLPQRLGLVATSAVLCTHAPDRVGGQCHAGGFATSRCSSLGWCAMGGGPMQTCECMAPTRGTHSASASKPLSDGRPPPPLTPPVQSARRQPAWPATRHTAIVATPTDKPHPAATSNQRQRLRTQPSAGRRGTTSTTRAPGLEYGPATTAAHT